MKNIILGIAFSILAITYILRVYFVNSTLPLPVTLKYEMGAEIEIEDDFFDSSDENMNGYTVTVLDTELLSIHEFIELYEIEDSSEYEHLEYMYLIAIRFTNWSNQSGRNGGISLSNYVLQKNSYITYMDRDAYRTINSVDAYAFALKIETKKELIIPFGIDTEYVDIQQIEKGVPQLVISAYPHKKVVNLSLQS